MGSLEQQLAASVAYVRERKRQQHDDLDEWLDAVPPPPKRPKRLKGKKMTQAIQLVPQEGEALAAAVVVRGDLSGLNEAQLKSYYVELCRSLELNPATQPFSLLTLNGKKMFYANKSCSDQLRKRDNVSVTIVSREHVDDLLIVHARATLPDGRTDESVGALPLGKLTGEARANAIMKCETKAKRRVTLSICGLGMLDESEVEGAMATERRPQLANIRPNHGPGEDPAAPDQVSDEFNDIMGTLGSADRYAFNPACTWEEMTRWRSIIGSKAAPSELGKRLSALWHGDTISPGQKKEMGALWNRIDRKLTQLEGKLKPPPIEASFTDEPEDGTEALGAPEREPGEEG